ncbi:MAG: hypothetical protein AVDCRST_MAG04-1911, partial [uncultured Acetobacteraceae bacterium]
VGRDQDTSLRGWRREAGRAG